MTFTGNLDHFVLFERIARERTDIPTLRTRGRDGLDFHDVSVWALLDINDENDSSGKDIRTPSYAGVARFGFAPWSFAESSTNGRIYPEERR